ncbi:hypothetical protein F5146DRAFT_1136163 [Armillaria mellea]|nr:hypothetical protein F5146DRAFT_1136163 [Armillaria mellea]
MNPQTIIELTSTLGTFAIVSFLVALITFTYYLNTAAEEHRQVLQTILYDFKHDNLVPVQLIFPTPLLDHHTSWTPSSDPNLPTYTENQGLDIWHPQLCQPFNLYLGDIAGYGNTYTGASSNIDVDIEPDQPTASPESEPPIEPRLSNDEPQTIEDLQQEINYWRDVSNNMAQQLTDLDLRMMKLNPLPPPPSSSSRRCPPNPPSIGIPSKHEPFLGVKPMMHQVLDKFAGAHANIERYLSNCNSYFATFGIYFPYPSIKIQLTSSLLTGPAKKWWVYKQPEFYDALVQ